LGKGVKYVYVGKYCKKFKPNDVKNCTIAQDLFVSLPMLRGCHQLAVWECTSSRKEEEK